MALCVHVSYASAPEGSGTRGCCFSMRDVICYFCVCFTMLVATICDNMLLVWCTCTFHIKHFEGPHDELHKLLMKRFPYHDQNIEWILGCGAKERGNICFQKPVESSLLKLLCECTTNPNLLKSQFKENHINNHKYYCN